MKSKYIDASALAALKKQTRGRGVAPWLPFEVADRTGLRIGDVLKLRAADLHEDGVHYVAQKTGKHGVAEVPPYLRRQLDEAARRSPSGWLFPSPYKQGEHLTRQAAWARLKTAAKRAGVSVDGISPHSLRKCYAVDLYKRKGLRAVQAALQHSTSDQTERYALADWFTGERSAEPLLRRDIDIIVRRVVEVLEAHKGAGE